VRDLIEGFWIGWLDLLTPHAQSSRLQAVQRYRWSAQFTVQRSTRTRGSQSSPVISWQRIYKRQNCGLESHTKFSFHSLIPFLPLFWNCQFRRLDLVQFLCSQAHVLTGWRFETQLTLLNLTLFINTLHGPRRQHSLSTIAMACLQRCCKTTEVTRLLLGYSLPREWLPSRCVVMNVYSDFTIQAFGRQVTLYSYYYIQISLAFLSLSLT
jgi:hypothetical protein